MEEVWCGEEIDGMEWRIEGTVSESLRCEIAKLIAPRASEVPCSSWVFLHVAALADMP